MNAFHGYPIFDCLPPTADVRPSIEAGLLAAQASIAPRYFYDPLGCILYEAITKLDEYYPTRTERAILESSVDALKAVLPEGGQYIDLGSGDSEKASRLLPRLEPAAYLAVDIARSAIEAALPKLAKVAPHVRLAGVVTDFADSFDFASALEDCARIFVYPGSSIGNFAPNDAREFLMRLRAHCPNKADRLVIGVDSVKATARLDAAYDDALGVTAAFNLNVLRHLNALIDTDFDVRQWQHRGFFNVDASRIEMHLQARVKTTVRIGGQARVFDVDERIHTENSYKYTRSAFAALLQSAGFVECAYFTDAGADFHVFVARPA